MLGGFRCRIVWSRGPSIWLGWESEELRLKRFGRFSDQAHKMLTVFTLQCMCCYDSGADTGSGGRKILGLTSKLVLLLMMMMIMMMLVTVTVMTEMMDDDGDGDDGDDDEEEEEDVHEDDDDDGDSGSCHVDDETALAYNYVMCFFRMRLPENEHSLNE